MSEIEENNVLADVLGFRLRKAHNLLNQQWAKAALERGIEQTPVEAGILLLINANPGISQSALAGMLRIEAPTLSQALNRLLDGRVVNRDVAADDRRRRQLTPTKKGVEAFGLVTDLIKFRQNNPPGSLTSVERAQLNELLGKLLGS